MKKFRQGDVYILQVEDQEEHKFHEADNFILAYGEVTGHKHKLSPKQGGTIAIDKVDDMKIFVNVEGAGAEVTHEEHETIDLEPGKYEVRIQREYDPVRDSRAVLD